MFGFRFGILTLTIIRFFIMSLLLSVIFFLGLCSLTFSFNQWSNSVTQHRVKSRVESQSHLDPHVRKRNLDSKHMVSDLTFIILLTTHARLLNGFNIQTRRGLAKTVIFLVQQSSWTEMLSACQQMSSSLDELVVFSIICGTNLPFLVSLLFHVDILYNCVTENNSA